MNKIILDLCGGTGAWSRPYKDAGYDVRLITLPKQDVRDYIPPLKGVCGILAAPPCTQFSLARTTAKTPRNYIEGLSVVDACFRIYMSIVHQSWFDPKIEVPFFAMENPVAHLRIWYGEPQYIFEPWYFGDKHSKKTGLWGVFTNPAQKYLNREDVMSRWDIERCKSNSRELPKAQGLSQSDRRAITPKGFAKAFFEANP